MDKQRITSPWLPEVRSVLLDNGYIEFHWAICRTYLVYPNGNRKILDGRTYQGFLQTMADKLDESQTGNMEDCTLVISWKHNRKMKPSRLQQA